MDYRGKKKGFCLINDLLLKLLHIRLLNGHSKLIVIVVASVKSQHVQCQKAHGAQCWFYKLMSPCHFREVLLAAASA